MTGARLVFSGKDSRDRQAMTPFYLSEFLTIGNERHPESQPNPIDYRKEMPSAAQLRHAYELGLVAHVRRTLDPAYQLTEDEQSGFRVYNSIRRGEFLGEYLQFVRINGSPTADGFLPVEIINNPDSLVEADRDIWEAKGGERIVTEIPHIPRGGKKGWALPQRIGGELVYYNHGFPVAITEDINNVRRVLTKYIEQISDRKLPNHFVNGSDGISLREAAPFQITSGATEGVRVAFRVFDWNWNHNPYSIVIGCAPGINHSLGVRIRSENRTN